MRYRVVPTPGLETDTTAGNLSAFIDITSSIDEPTKLPGLLREIQLALLKPAAFLGSFSSAENFSLAAVIASFSAARWLTWRFTSVATSLYGKICAGYKVTTRAETKTPGEI